MEIERGDVDNLLYKRYTDHKENHADRYIDHYLEQYRIYIHVFNTTSERRLKSNEFFLAINTAIMGILGYLEAKGPIEKPLIFTLVPFVGIAICYCWYQIIRSYKQLNSAKFKVIHSAEKKLPLALWETEWELLGQMKDPKKYRPLSSLEKYIPVIFTVLYILIFFANVPWSEILNFAR
jgi:hypothetical protein